MALLQQPNLEKAAAAVGISVSTAYRLRRDPDFHNQYLEARRECVSQALARLQQGCAAAVSTLLKIMVDPGQPAGSRVRAAGRIIEHARRLLVAEDQEVRLQQVEQWIAGARSSIAPGAATGNAGPGRRGA